jgi:DNA transformation protein
MPQPPATKRPADEFADYCLELLSPQGPVRAKRMFGGHGLYLDDVFVALIADERLYLKADDESRSAFEAAGCAPFTYDAKGKQMTMNYWSVPDEAMESPALFQPWARRALEAGLRSRTKLKGRSAGKTSRPASARSAAAKR